LNPIYVVDRGDLMNRPSAPLSVGLLIAVTFLPLAAHGEDSPTKPSSATALATGPLLPRGTVVPVSTVTKYFPSVTEEASTGLNETTVGKAIGSLSVVFTSTDGRKKVTLSVDEYTNERDAAAAFQTAVEGSKVAPGFKLTAPPNLGQKAFAGSSEVGAEMHFGLGARDGRLIISATHAGDIPLTTDNSNNLIGLSGEEFATARQALGP
jgi:hypothetical protein